MAGVLIVAALGAVCWFMFAGGDTDASKVGKRHERIKEERAKSVVKETDETTDAEAKVQSKLLAEANDKIKEYITKVPTNEIEWVNKPLDPDDPDNAMRTRVSFAISSILAIAPGDHIPEFMTAEFLGIGDGDPKDGGNKEFEDSLKKWQITIKETDSLDVAEHKKRVFDSQMELLDGINAGGSVDSALREAYDYRVRSAEFRDSVVEMVKAMHEDGHNNASTREMLKSANEKLAAKGLVLIDEAEVIPDEDVANEEPSQNLAEGQTEPETPEEEPK